MFDPDLQYAKSDALNAIARHIFSRKRPEPQVLTAALMFIKRRHPDIWNTDEGRQFVAAIREVADAEENYASTEQMRTALLTMARANGFAEDFSLDHVAFKGR